MGHRSRWLLMAKSNRTAGAETVLCAASDEDAIMSAANVDRSQNSSRGSRGAQSPDMSRWPTSKALFRISMVAV
jgi:hypothetical protein